MRQKKITLSSAEFRLNGNEDVLAEVISSIAPFDIGSKQYHLTKNYINKFIIDMISSFEQCKNNHERMVELAKSCEVHNDELREYISEIMQHVIENQILEERKVYEKSNFSTIHYLDRDSEEFKSVYRKRRYPKGYSELFKGFTKVIASFYNEHAEITGADIQKVVECFATAGRIYMQLKPSKETKDIMYEDYKAVVRGSKKLLPYPGFDSDENMTIAEQVKFVNYCNQYKDLIIELANLSPKERRLHANKKLLKKHGMIVQMYHNFGKITSEGFDNLRDVYESTSSTGSKLEVKVSDGFENEFQELQFNGILSKSFDTLDNIVDSEDGLKNKEVAEAIIKLRERLGIPDHDEQLALPAGQCFKFVRMQQRIKPFNKPKWIKEVDSNGNIYMKKITGEPYGDLVECEYTIKNISQFSTNIYIDKPGFGIRCITIASNVVQEVLAYFQNKLRRGMSMMEADCTIDQDKGRLFSKKLTMQDIFNHASFDLSKCTDNMDLRFQSWVLKNFVFYNNPELVDYWETIMRLNIKFGEEYIQFFNGQAQGFLSSFPSFALAHHLIVNIIYFIEEIEYEQRNVVFGDLHPDQRPYGSRYRVLGDDFICSFVGTEMLKSYPNLIARINVTCHEKKGFRYIKGSEIPEYAVNRAEFAKTTYCRGMRVSGISPNIISKLNNNVKYQYDVIRDLIKGNGLTLPIIDKHHGDDVSSTWIEGDLQRYIFRKCITNILPENESIHSYVDVMGLPIPKNIIEEIDYKSVLCVNSLNCDYYGGLVDSNTFSQPIYGIPEHEWSDYNKIMFKIYISIKIISIGLKYAIPKHESERLERNLRTLKSSKERVEAIHNNLYDFIRKGESSIRLTEELFNYQGKNFENSWLYKSLKHVHTFENIKENLYDYHNLFGDDQEDFDELDIKEKLIDNELLSMELEIIMNEADKIINVGQFISRLINTNAVDLSDDIISDAKKLLTVFEGNKYRKNKNSVIDSSILTYMYICHEWYRMDKESLMHYFDGEEVEQPLSHNEEVSEFSIDADIFGSMDFEF